VIFIFKGFDIKALIEKVKNNIKTLKNNDFVLKLLDFTKANRTKIKYVSLSVVGVSLVVVSLLLAGVTVGVKVSYSGKDIAIVKNESVLNNALTIVKSGIADEQTKNSISAPKYSLTVTVADRLQNAETLADTIIDNTENIKYASALMVNGEVKAVTASDRMEEYLNKRKNLYFVKGADNKSEFVEKVEIVKGYYLKDEIKDFADAKAAIDSLGVKTVSVVKTKTEIPYKTIKKTTSKQNIGYSKVTTAGCNGTSVKTETVENLNGKVVSRTEMSNEVISKPVDEVVLVGTAVKTVSASERAKASSAGFICPLNKGTYFVSSYWGDGRNHKAVDLAADRGTPIFAAGGGTVTYAGYDSDFGYNVIIKHSNGISTRYAHASALCVKRGQVVSQGDMIAAVGSTGWSTGDHLHFEVIVNGVRVNPAPYIGL